MIGDRLVITDYHRDAAAQVLPAVHEKLDQGGGTLAVSIAGESGSGKTEVACVLAESLEDEGRKCLVIAQDDYFRFPPRSNHENRLKDISVVGTQEVRLVLIERHIDTLKNNPDAEIVVPVADFAKNRITGEVVKPGRLDVIIVEGTYTTLLHNLDLRAFIDRNFRQTKKARLIRARDPDVAFLEQVLVIEHKEISRHKRRADIIIPPPPEELGVTVEDETSKSPKLEKSK